MRGGLSPASFILRMSSAASSSRIGGVARQVVQLPWVAVHIVEKIIGVYVAVRAFPAVFARRVHAVQIARRTHATPYAAFADLSENSVLASIDLPVRYGLQIFTDHIG